MGSALPRATLLQPLPPPDPGWRRSHRTRSSLLNLEKTHTRAKTRYCFSQTKMSKIVLSPPPPVKRVPQRLARNPVSCARTSLCQNHPEQVGAGGRNYLQGNPVARPNSRRRQNGALHPTRARTLPLRDACLRGPDLSGDLRDTSTHASETHAYDSLRHN